MVPVARKTQRPKPPGFWKPTREQRLAAVTKRVPDVVAPDLRVLFCGINPGLYSAAVGHHFAGPGNMFWPTLYSAGFTPRVLSPFEESQLLDLGLGITNLAPRATAAADELDPAEIRRGVGVLRRKVLKLHPRFLAVVGLQAYRIGFEDRRAVVGLQPSSIGPTKIWLLPNPSGLNAFHQPPVLKKMFGDLYKAAFAPRSK